MPLTRYQIRNEYRLADPELYRAADKDDPEALLEGVAMAGLVGVLRQLGDLAEFAAEIFHNLHEEVMVTAARGHGLTLRVQQLEVEFLSIEKAFLSQTCHSPFLHNSGVDWHPNLKLDHSPITEEDLPRFVMDSYEDCRGPPRLFLLDKFDVAGAGACLKRYTDPSFFKAEFAISEATKEEHKREKKARKVRKKGSRWRTGDNPDVTASHSKLHQLLLEERCQSQINVPTHHVKLKRRLSSNSLIDSTSVKNYMEKLLNSDSPDTKLVCESSSNPSHLNMGSSDTSGLASDHQTQGRSPANKLVTGDINPIPSHSRDGKILKPSMAGSGVDIIEERNSDSMVEPASEANFESIPSNFYKGEDRKTIQTAHTHVGLRAHTSDLTQSPHMQEPPALDLEDKFSFAVNGKGNTEAIAEGYHSDDGNSEIENYTDALTTMDSEVDTDTESRPKNERSLKTERKCLVSETDEVKHESPAAFPDSVSIGKAMISEDKNDLLEKRRLSSYEADTVSNSSEHLPSDGDRIAAFLPSTLSNAEVSSRRTYVISSQSRLGEAEIPHPNSIMITSNVLDSVAGQLSPRSENDESLGHDLSCVTNVSDIPFQSRHDSLYMGPQKGQTLELSDGRNDGSNGISSRLPDILGAPHEVKEAVKDAEERASIGISDDSDAYQMNGKFDSPDSVLLNTETEVYDLAEQDQEARLGASRTPECRPHYPTDGDVEDLRTERTVVGSEEVQPSGETSEHLASVVACHETHESEQKEPEIRDQAASLESDMARVGTSDSEVEALCNNLESNISDSCGSEMGGSCNNVDFNKAYREVKEGHAPQIVQFNPDRERNSDLSLDTRKNISEAEPPFEVADSETTSNFPKIIGDIGVCHSPIGPMDGAVNKNYMEVIEDPSANYFTNSNSEVEVDNQLTSVLSDCNGSACNLEKNHLSSPMYDAQDLLMAESIQTHTDLTGDPEVTSSIKEGDQKKELKQHLPCASVEAIFSPSTSLIEPGALLEEEQKFPARVESDLHPDASNIQLLNPQPHVPVLDISVHDNNNAQGNVEEMPPLPPLPPMQWRIGKFQHDSPASRGELTVPSFNTSLPMLAEEADWIAQQGFPIFCGKLAQPVDSFLQLPTSNVNNPQMVKQMSGEEVEQTSWSPSVAVPAIECQNVLMDHLYLPTTTEPLNPFSLLTDKDLQHDSSNAGEEMLQHTSLNMMGSSSSTDDLKSQRVSLTSEDNLEQSLDSLPLRQYREDQQMHHTLELEPSVENENIGHDSRTLEGELKWQSNSSAVVPTVDYGKPLGTLRSRLSRPRDPLIEAVASHDKSNLRKVTERIVPKIEPQPDERNSLLEQIRNKSFNLKPAVSMRPSVQGPKTNLKVVAILEKANAIRQALAGSDDDEDDEDSWSDS